MDSELSNDAWPPQSTNAVIAGRTVSIQVHRLATGTLLDVIPEGRPLAEILRDVGGAVVFAALIVGSSAIAFSLARAFLDPRKPNMQILLTAIALTPPIAIFATWLIADTRKWRRAEHEQGMRFENGHLLERLGVLFKSSRTLAGHLDAGLLQHLARKGTVNGAIRVAAAARIGRVEPLAVNIEPTWLNESDPAFRELYISQRIDPDSQRFDQRFCVIELAWDAPDGATHDDSMISEVARRSCGLMIKGSDDWRTSSDLVDDAQRHKRLRELADQAETIDAIRRGMDEIAQGKTEPAEKVFEELRRKYDVPR